MPAAQAMTGPLVTVVLPCFNAHRYLGETLDSVRAQTWADIEIIVVDDGSTDPATAAFLAALPADIRVIRQENRGLAGARNTGFRAAAGQYVLPLDCDDRIAPEMIASCVAALESSGRAYAHAQIKVFGDEDGIVAKTFNYFEQIATNQLPYCMLIRHDAWAAVGGYDESLRHGYEDWEFNIHLGATGRFGAAVHAPLFHYRASAAGMLKSVSQAKHAAIWRAIRRKHRDVYGIAGLVGVWWTWRVKPSTHPLWLVWALLAAAWLLPDGWFNRLFFFLHRHGRSKRVA